MANETTGTRRRTQAGFTLIEMSIVAAILALMAAFAVPRLTAASDNQALRDSAAAVASAVNAARIDAIRTGNVFIVFYMEDAESNPLLDANSNPVPILILDDGRPGTVNQNCKIDGGEPFRTGSFDSAVSIGIASGTGKAPADNGNGDYTTGSSYTEPGGGQASWVLFRPQGIPVSFDSACSLGTVGTGSGAFYMNNGDRTAAVAVSPLGTSRVYSWKGTWSL